MEPLKPGDLCVALVDEVILRQLKKKVELIKKGDVVTVVSELVLMEHLTPKNGHFVLAEDGRIVAATPGVLRKIGGVEGYDGNRADTWKNCPFWRPDRRVRFDV
jgi:hypothetical protein